MKREIIMIDEYGKLDIPTDTAAIWMTEAEIVELFGTTAGVVSSAIKAIIKSDALNDYEACKCIRPDSGNSVDVYNLEMVVALAFRIRSQGATKLREYILRTLGAVDKQPAINILWPAHVKRVGTANGFSTERINNSIKQIHYDQKRKNTGDRRRRDYRTIPSRNEEIETGRGRFSECTRHTACNE